MKKTTLFAALLCLAQSTLHADVPLFINYQGKVADATGLPIGASGTAAAPVAAPVNRKVIFRIYDAATGGNRLWTEEQTVTISLGLFSVLLGNGINPTGTASTESRPVLDTIFTPSTATSRFLEIMVDNGDNAIGATDVPISPRQQITSTAFALHAKVADGIASSTDLMISPATLPLGSLATNYGLGWYGAGRLFNSVEVDGPVLYGNKGGALGSNVNGTQKLALAWNAAGQVGVGASSSYETNNKLTLQGDDSATPARQLVIRGNTESAKRLNIGFNTSADLATLQSYTANSTPGNLVLNPISGNVGIGNNSPNAKLSIGTPIFGITTPTNFSGTIKAPTLSTSFVTGAGALGQTVGSELLLGNFGFSSPGNSQSLAFSAYRTGAGATWSDTALVLGMNVDVDARAGAYLSLHSNTNVGIGTTSPAHKLDVVGTAQVSSTLTVGSTLNVTGTVTAPSFTGSGANLTSGTIPMAALVAAVQQSLCPVGSIMPYGGTTAPAGWLLCNGTSYSRTAYPSLFTAIGTNYGTANTTSFNVPDFRGRFLRGFTTDTARDPDLASRGVSTAGGATGGVIGSLQADAVRSHAHGYNDIFHSEGGGTVALPGNRGSGDSDGDNTGYQIARTSDSTGGSETRPANVTVNYIIKY